MIQEKEQKLESLAVQDKNYILWRRCWEEYAPQFEAFVNGQPDEVQNILWAMRKPDG